MVRASGTPSLDRDAFAQDVPVCDLRAERGLVEGSFTLSVPPVADTQMFLRLRAVTGGTLTGKVFARTRFGEISMQVEMAKE